MFPTTSFTLLREMVDPARRDAAWATFHARYGPPIRGCCLKWQVPPHDLDVVVNGVLVHLLTRLDRYSPRDGVRFRAWLSPVVRNYVMTEHRGDRLFKSFGPLPDDDLTADRPQSAAMRFADEVAGGVGALLDDDQVRAMRDVQAEVSDRDWDIAMSVLADEPAKQVGERHGLDPRNTGKVAHAVKLKIQDRWRAILGQ